MCRSGILRPAGLVKHLLAATVLWALLSGPAQADVSFNFFYSSLGPHGSWLVSAEYGHVWRPGVYVPGWNPYYDGHWVYTDLGWAWASDYSWGAIPYHYGTWVLDPYLGWVWVPGYVWAPAWVVFSTGPDHIGWCPVPIGYSVGAALTFADLPSGGFVFVGTRDFLAPRVRIHAVPASRNRVVLARTKMVNRITVRNDVVVNPGPDVRMVERAGGRGIRVVPIERVERIAPARMRREHLRVDAKERGRGLRAAEPWAERAAPVARAGRDRPERSREETLRRDDRAPRDDRVRRDGTVRRPDTPSHENTVRRDRVMREDAARRDATGERSAGRQVAPQRRSDSQQVAKPEDKPRKKPEKKPPDRKPKDREASGAGGQNRPR